MRSHPLSIPEAVLNIIEHVACRLAERCQGRVTPPHLMPYVPLCLEELRACLDDMVDDESVLAVPGEVGAVYQFSAYQNLPIQPGALSLEACVACGTELLSQPPGVLCPECTAVLHKAGERAARLHGWAPQARLEHALLYAATQQGGGPVSVATLASRSHQGSSQRYGTLRLGTQRDILYDFVFDLISGPHPVVYCDANQNGNLTDDGQPLTNQGSGIFATTIHLPFRRLVRDAPFPGDFTLWFFTNDSMWPRGTVAHYSRTQLQGKVSVDGQAYVAYIADTGVNDTDLTNDGISVDVNGDGNIDRQQEFFPPGQVAYIHGKEYVFVITW